MQLDIEVSELRIIIDKRARMPMRSFALFGHSSSYTCVVLLFLFGLF